MTQTKPILQNSQEYLAPRYLTELFPKLSNERTNFRLRSRENFTQLRTVEPLRFKSLFFHQQSLAGILWT